MEYFFDYHIHSNFSFDARSTIYEICKSAVEKGIKEIAITDHWEQGLEDENEGHYNADDYYSELLKARELFGQNLIIKIGVEIGQPQLSLKVSENLIKEIPYDYVIGSIHRAPVEIDLKDVDYTQYTLEDICDIYLNEIKKLVTAADFDCLGHLGLVRRYGFSHYNRRITSMLHKELLQEILEKIIYRGKGLEINTSGLRQKSKEAMPGIDVLKFYKELGGEILTIGSDAHNHNDLGKGFQEAVQLAREVGFEYLTLFDQRKPKMIPIK